MQKKKKITEEQRKHEINRLQRNKVEIIRRERKRRIGKFLNNSFWSHKKCGQNKNSSKSKRISKFFRKRKSKKDKCNKRSRNQKQKFT